MRNLNQEDIEYLDFLAEQHQCKLYMPPNKNSIYPFFLFEDIKNNSYDMEKFFYQLQSSGFSFTCNKEGFVEIIGIM